ncbi:MAG: GTPase Era [Bdellovibrionaceae bacterium]|nr:GTPase Era [Pseudobdellovibrionaceae bacterium]
MEEKKHKAGFISLLGPSNAGKSTLCNFLIEEKVSIVSAKVQSTRQRVKGIYNDENSQLVFVDAPGFIYAEKGLNHFLQKEWQEALQDADCLIFLVRANCIEKDLNYIEKFLIYSKQPCMLIINKMDLVKDKNQVLAVQTLTQAFIEKAELKKTENTNIKTWFVSLSKDNNFFRKELIDSVVDTLPESPAFYDKDIYTSQSMRDLGEEYIREACFSRLSQELPYSLVVQIREWKKVKAIYHIHADLIVSRESHKGIVVGKNGEMIKRIGQNSRGLIEKLMGEKIFLKLFVKVREDWADQEVFLKEYKYTKKK